MKTKEQIINWLDKQSFSDKFYKNVALQGYKLYFTENFISSAFAWGDTSEGVIFWGKVEKDYINWFNSSSLDDYIFISSKVNIPLSKTRTFKKLDILNKLYIIRDNRVPNEKCSYKICTCDGSVVIVEMSGSGMSFPTYEQAKDFLKTFRNELEEVKEYL